MSIRVTEVCVELVTKTINPTPFPPIVPSVTILEGVSSQQPGPPFAPLIVSLAAANNTVVAGLVPNPISGLNPIVKARLYRKPVDADPSQYVLVDERDLSPTAFRTLLFDDGLETLPNPTRARHYAGTVVDTIGQESDFSTVPQQWTGFDNTQPNWVTIPRSISKPAFGSLGGLLGQDVYLDPLLREAVIGPNGDLLTVNGLALLAQDLRIRLLTELGTLPYHLDFGLDPSVAIGSGQADPVAQAQILRTRIVDVLTSDARVQSVPEVTVSLVQPDGWVVAYTVEAKGAADSLIASAVIPINI